jgi:hypothetical protein
MPHPVIRRVFTAFETANEYGRLGALVGVFDTEALAKAAAQGKGYYNSEGSVREGRVIEFDGHTYLLSDYVIGTVEMNVDMILKAKNDKAAAQAKLQSAMSQEELDLLGIKL